jgi:soluble lytic murein transglycosylase
MTEQQLRQAAKLAQNWGWHDRAILTIARTQYSDDLELRFPLVHHEQILSQAKINHIDPAFAYAIIRQESAFTVDARSHAGALGLMQVMPHTAQQLAKGLDIKINHTLDILDVTNNLQFGMKYLRKALNRYDNNRVLASAAYNAGPYRVKKWLPEKGIVASDLWTETLPIAETRNYIENIMAYTAIYEQRMGRQPTPLTIRMPPITAPNTALSANSTSSRSNETPRSTSLSYSLQD